MPVITIQELNEASSDAFSIEKFVNGAPADVVPRYGDAYPNQPKMVQTFNTTQDARQATFDATQTERAEEFDDAQDYRETTFVATQADKEARFQEFLSESGYQDLGDYAAGITFTAYNQVMHRSGELYGVKASVALPYTTTGVWGTEGVNFISRGDAALRQELASPTGTNLSTFTQGDAGSVPLLLTEVIKQLGKTATQYGLIEGIAVTNAAGALINANAINASIAALSRDGVHTVPPGSWVVSRPIVINKGFITINWIGQIVASDDFVGESLVVVTPGGSENFYRWPIHFESFNVNARFKARIMNAYNMDHMYMNAPRFEASLGRALLLDKIRESNLVFPVFTNCAHRDNFATPADWNTGPYTVGQYARVKDDDWLVGTSYVRDDIRRYAGNRFICRAANAGNQPDTNPLLWKKIPHEDYKCVVANTNKNPQSNNTNSVTVGNRVWQKVYQDEATVEIVDYAIDASDRSNQIVLESPIIRDCGNKCFIRIDSSKLPSRPVTHFDVFGGHFHGLAGQQAGIVPELPIPDLQRCIEIGYAINTNIYATNIRCGDGNDCIAVMFGDGGSTKVSQDLRLRDCALSGDGSNDIGLLVMPSTQASLSSVLEVSFLMTHATSAEMHDPRRVMRRTSRTEDRKLLPSGLDGVVGGFTVEAPSTGYADARPYSYKNTADVSTRYDIQITPTNSQLRLGPGDNTYTAWQVATATPQRMTLQANRELSIAGTWDFPLIMAGSRIWVAAGGVLRIKTSAPTSDTDGTVVGTQA